MKEKNKKMEELHADYDISSIDPTLFEDPVLLLEYLLDQDSQKGESFQSSCFRKPIDYSRISSARPSSILRADKKVNQREKRIGNVSVHDSLETEILRILKLSAFPLDIEAIQSRSDILRVENTEYLKSILVKLKKSRKTIEYCTNKGKTTLYAYNSMREHKAKDID